MLPEGTTTFFVRDSDARVGLPADGQRVVQWKARAQLRLLQVAARLPGGAATQGAAAQEPTEEMLAEADSRALDGVHVASLGQVVLLRPRDHVALIDDDKQAGLSQQLLTDMFTRMSLR